MLFIFYFPTLVNGDNMSQNFFITGMPKVGKTTIIDELKKRGLRVGGFISPEEKHHGTRTGFYIKDIETGRIARLAAVDADGPKVSKYHVDIKSFESIAVPCMKNVDMYDVFVVDEIGRMELKSRKFVELLDAIFQSRTPVIASLHRDYVERYGIEGEVLILTPTNREAVFLDLVKRTTEAYIKKKAKPKPKKMNPKFKKEKPPKRKKEKPKKEKKEKPRPEKKRGLVGTIKDLIGI